MKASRALFILFAGIVTIVIPLTYNACSKGFEVSDLASQVDFSKSPAPVNPPPDIEVPPCSGGGCEPEALPNSSVSPFKDSLLTADQVLRSLGALTQITLSPENESAILAQYSTRLSSLPSDYNPSSINAPSIISVASLAGEFCEIGLKKDSTASSSQRKLLLTNVDLAADSISETEFIQSGQKLANRFWGRSLSDSETTAVREFYLEMQNASDANAKKSAKDMLRALCGAMLASFDSISI